MVRAEGPSGTARNSRRQTSEKELSRVYHGRPTKHLRNIILNQKALAVRHSIRRRWCCIPLAELVRRQQRQSHEERHARPALPIPSEDRTSCGFLESRQPLLLPRWRSVPLDLQAQRQRSLGLALLLLPQVQTATTLPISWHGRMSNSPPFPRALPPQPDAFPNGQGAGHGSEVSSIDCLDPLQQPLKRRVPPKTALAKEA